MNILSEKGHFSKKKSKRNKKRFTYIGKFLFLFVKFSVKNTIRLKKYYQTQKSYYKAG